MVTVIFRVTVKARVRVRVQHLGFGSGGLGRCRDLSRSLVHAARLPLPILRKFRVRKHISKPKP